MSGCCGLNIVNLGGPGAPFTFSVTGGNSPYNGGLGVITGPIVVNSGDILCNSGISKYWVRSKIGS